MEERNRWLFRYILVEASGAGRRPCTRPGLAGAASAGLVQMTKTSVLQAIRRTLSSMIFPPAPNATPPVRETAKHRLRYGRPPSMGSASSTSSRTGCDASRSADRALGSTAPLAQRGAALRSGEGRCQHAAKTPILGRNEVTKEAVAMKRAVRWVASIGLLAALASGVPSAEAAGNPMKLVGALNPWKDGQFSNVAADAGRHVAYLGSFDDQGVAVIDTTDSTQPVLADRLSTHITSDALTSDSADLDLVGRYLAVSHQPWNDERAFAGISIYDTANPYHPTLVRRVALPGGIHTVQLDPEVERGRPYAYANAFEFGTTEVFVVNVSTGAVVGTYRSSEPQGCQPSEAQCDVFNSPHEGFLQRHPRSGRMLDYVSYWDSGLRIVDVTDPARPVEVGAFDYPGLPGDCCAHYPAQVGFWHINGHPVQAAAINGQGSGAINGVFQRFFTWDAHNLDVKGEDTLLVANYTMGIRLVDTTDKADPAETAFYLPNANKRDACKQHCYFQGRETWGAYFGADQNIYASDFWLGFFIVNPS